MLASHALARAAAVAVALLVAVAYNGLWEAPHVPCAAASHDNDKDANTEVASIAYATTASMASPSLTTAFARLSHLRATAGSASAAYTHALDAMPSHVHASASRSAEAGSAARSARPAEATVTAAGDAAVPGTSGAAVRAAVSMRFPSAGQVVLGHAGAHASHAGGTTAALQAPPQAGLHRELSFQFDAFIDADELGTWVSSPGDVGRGAGMLPGGCFVFLEMRPAHWLPTTSRVEADGTATTVPGAWAVDVGAADDSDTRVAPSEVTVNETVPALSFAADDDPSWPPAYAQWLHLAYSLECRAPDATAADDGGGGAVAPWRGASFTTEPQFTVLRVIHVHDPTVDVVDVNAPLPSGPDADFDGRRLLTPGLTPDVIALRSRYLDAVARSLVNEAYAPFARASGSPEAQALSMDGVIALDAVRACVDHAVVSRIQGDFLEAGAWRGGGCTYMAASVASLPGFDATQRRVWCADSYEDGYPAVDDHDVNDAGNDLSAPHFVTPQSATSLELAVNTMRAHGLLTGDAKVLGAQGAQAHLTPIDSATGAHDWARSNASVSSGGSKGAGVTFVTGYFNDSMPSVAAQLRSEGRSLALLRLDTGMYASTMSTLEALHEFVSPGGCVIVNDYDWPFSEAAKRAVLDFRTSQGVEAPLMATQAVDGRRAVFWIKE